MLLSYLLSLWKTGVTISKYFLHLILGVIFEIFTLFKIMINNNCVDFK